ncbi:MAG: hydrogenase nickel incorporation protein HypA [Thermoplasmata archaeon]|nr:hydrogenase nickel incorporation protein HypA [Thermoplasmata archaeon]
MHEWALAEAVISTVKEIAEKENFSMVKQVNIKIGELQGIEIDIFEFALKELLQGNLKNAEIRIKVVKTKFRCNVCGYEWKFDESKNLDEEARESIHFIPEVVFAYTRCPKCGSPDFEIMEGRGVWVESIRGEK